MAGMPDWFAKTREMAAMDKYFSLRGAKTRIELVRRYRSVLARLASERDYYAKDSHAMRATMPAQQRQFALGSHFAGDWVHPLYFVDRAAHGHLGGLFWPTIPSTKVIDEIRTGIEIAIQKALGDTELARLGYVKDYRDWLWTDERTNDIEVNGVLPLATSWNCVAPTGSDFFDVAALRGPSIVEFAIATPQPYGISMTRRVASMLENEQLQPLAPGSSIAPPPPPKTSAAKAAKAPARRTKKASTPTRKAAKKTTR